MLRPYTVARYGVYLAAAVALMSIWLGQRAGATFDFTLLRAVFVFVLFVAIGFGAEAVLTFSFQPRPPAAPITPSITPPPADVREHTDD
ncbi:MAG: hypothetical protein ACRDG3_07245 [Tepidiformaceae bacterium]